jgi:hypothetical protein
MNELSGLLRDIAEQVPGYDVGDSALRIARRRRKIRRIAPAVLPLVLVASIVAVWLPLHRAGTPSDTVVSWLPSRIPAPDAASADLPADRAVGVAAMVYTPCPKDCWRIVVLRDGAQYRLASPGSAPIHKLSAALSPDGHWVAYSDANGDLVLRDLTTSTASTFAGMRPRGWSPGSRYLVLAPTDGTLTMAFTVVDLATGKAIRSVSPRASASGSFPDLAGILDDGRLIWVAYEYFTAPLPDSPVDPRTLLQNSALVQITDPEARQVIHQWSLRPPKDSAYLAPTSAIIPMPDGRLLVRFTVAYSWGIAQGPAQIAEAETGEILARYSLPGAAGPLDVWGAAGVAGQKLIAVHGRTTQPQVALFNPNSATPQPICLVEGGYGMPLLPGN